MLRELLVYDGHQVCSLRREQDSVGVHAEPVQRVRRPACMQLILRHSKASPGALHMRTTWVGRET